jgi:hypothetical protein
MFGAETGVQLPGFAELEKGAVSNRFQSLVARHLKVEGTECLLANAGLFVTILAVFSPVSVLARIEAWECRDYGWGFGPRHIEIGLALIEVIEPGFVFGLAGECVVRTSTRGVSIGVCIGIGDIEGGGVCEDRKDEGREV